WRRRQVPRRPRERGRHHGRAARPHQDGRGRIHRGDHPGGGSGSPGGGVDEFSVVRDWVFVEADFLREYEIDLGRELEAMTWRRFLILLRGLSPQSATVTAGLSRTEFGTKEKVTAVEGPKATQQTFLALFGRG